MRTPLIQANIVERILRDAAGRQVRVTFYVYERDGRVKARILGVEYVGALAGKPSNRPFALCGAVSPCSAGSGESAKPEPVVSPYADSNILYTCGSKPRAPSA